MLQNISPPSLYNLQHDFWWACHDMISLHAYSYLCMHACEWKCRRQANHISDHCSSLLLLQSPVCCDPLDVPPPSSAAFASQRERERESAHQYHDSLCLSLRNPKTIGKHEEYSLWTSWMRGGGICTEQMICTRHMTFSASLQLVLKPQNCDGDTRAMLDFIS